MKRILVSIIVGIGCSLVAFGLIQTLKNRFKRYGSAAMLYNGELKIRIGSDSDDKRSVTTTLSQIKKRIEFAGDLSAKQLDKNNFLLIVRKIGDSVYTKKVVSESMELAFLETYMINEIEESVTAVQNELEQRRKKTNEPTDKYAFLSDEENTEAKKNGTCRLTDLIDFFHPTQAVGGKLQYTPAIGRVKLKDTVYLNKLLDDPKIKSTFPGDLKFVYGKKEANFKEKDTTLMLFAIKALNQKILPFPTGDNVEDCRLDFEPATGEPIIQLKFDAKGADSWYDMTKRNVGRPIALLANGFVLSAPVVESPIEGGESRISGNFTTDEALYLSTLLRTGRLALTVKLIESKFEPAKKVIGTFWMLGLVFLLSSVLAYSISLLIKPNSKP